MWFRCQEGINSNDERADPRLEESNMKICKSIILMLSGIGVGGVLGANVVAAGDVNKLVETCAGCHGKDGASQDPNVPIIGGVASSNLHDNLVAYQNKERPCPEAKFAEGSRKGQKTDMCQIAKELSEADINQVAQYFSAKKFVPAQQKFDEALAKEGKAYFSSHCEKCHTEGGSIAADESGILAGQWIPYLKSSLDEFMSGKRPMDKKMKPKIDELNQQKADALINYLGSEK
jgi:sulfide dehydrogenase cytochrome subunit